MEGGGRGDDVGKVGEDNVYLLAEVVVYGCVFVFFVFVRFLGESCVWLGFAVS